MSARRIERFTIRIDSIGSVLRNVETEREINGFWIEARIVRAPRERSFVKLYNGWTHCSLRSVPSRYCKPRTIRIEFEVFHFELNPDGSRLAVSRWHGPQGTMGPAVIELYETPLSWRANDPSFDPKTVYLPLRFYIPKDAPDAIDSNGKPFNPPRTHVDLDLRYGNEKLLKKILDGPYHKGKWHEWVYDMTPYPKGTYIMHTEIGGVVKDEKMEVR